MRIIIDGRSLDKGGVGSILLGILENIDYTKNDIAVLGDKELLASLQLPFKIIHCKRKSHSLFGYINPRLSNEINDYDCYFTPDYVIPRGIHINCYCVFRDMLFADRRKRNHRLFKDSIKSRVAKRSYKIAKKIFTISNFSKQRIEEYFGKEKEIEVINLNATNAFINAIDHEKKKKKNYFVYVGNARNHKNLETVIECLNKTQWKHALHILIKKEDLATIDKKTLKTIFGNPYIIIIDGLTTKEYAKEIRDAIALIQPSSYEGLGMQIIEALNYKTPVILSDIAAFKELYGKEDVYFYSLNKQEELIELLNRDEFVTKGLSDEFKSKHDNKLVADKLIKCFEKTTKKPHLRRNFIFNVIYQILVVLTPLITAPYVSRVLGASNIGMFSFAYTISYYFIIIGSLGFQQYAQRAIAEKQDDKEEQSRIFWQIVIARLVPVSISLLLLFGLYFLGAFGAYSKLIFIFSIIVISTIFDINFYFHGKENFFIVMLINIAIRVVGLFLIFTFVTTKYDLDKYTLLYSLMVAGGYLSMWVMLPTNLKKVKLNGLQFKKHMKASLSLFLPVAAVSIYAILDKTLIGLLVTGKQYLRVGNITVIAFKADVESGLYYQAERIIKALLSIILAYGTVMATRNTIEYSNRRKGIIKLNIYKSFNFLFALGFPIIFGTLAVAQPFIPVFYGDGYEGAIKLLMWLSPIILFSGISNILGVQYLIPMKRDRQYSISILIGFAINIVLTVILIPLMQYFGYSGALGAVFGTIISEFFIGFIQFIFVRKEISPKIIFKLIWKYLLAGLIMWVVCYSFYYFVLVESKTKNIIDLIIIIPTGVVVYYLALLILKDKMIFKYTQTFFIKIASMFKKDNNEERIQANTVVTSIGNMSGNLRIKQAPGTSLIQRRKKVKDEKDR